MIAGPTGNWRNDKPQTLKTDFSISYFSIPNGQMGITSLRIIQFQNFNHHYKWENVNFNNIPKTQFSPCAQKSLIWTEWVTYYHKWNQSVCNSLNSFNTCMHFGGYGGYGACILLSSLWNNDIHSYIYSLPVMYSSRTSVMESGASCIRKWSPLTKPQSQTNRRHLDWCRMVVAYLKSYILSVQKKGWL